MIYVIVHFTYGDRPFVFDGMAEATVETLCAVHDAPFDVVAKPEYDACLAALPAIS